MPTVMEKQMKRNTPLSAIKRPQRPQNSNWQYYVVATACCSILVAGFFLAARQHFTSMEYGLQNSRLRRQLDELQAEKRKLIVTREVSMSPIELRKAARRIGFMDTPVTTVSEMKPANPAAQKSVIRTVEAAKAEAIKPAAKLVKTVINAPAVRSERLDKQARRDAPAAKKDRT